MTGLPMRPNWRHWWKHGDLVDAIYYTDGFGFRFTVTATSQHGYFVGVLRQGLRGNGWVNSAIRLPKVLCHDTFDAAMIAAEKLRDWLGRRTEAERNAIFEDWYLTATKGQIS